ncbi:MAG: hypothetical protein SFY81_00550 [Verrucomicrobiota bacterium]|nr:hypothetical protein [Verrucomicrobiota bacterium]
MKGRFQRNIDGKGRLFRGLLAVGLLVGGGLACPVSRGRGVVLLGSAVFVGFEAVRGWCALRACGIKTRL